MIRRLLAFAALALPVGCHRPPDDPVVAAAAHAASVPCALAGQTVFQPDCTVQKIDSAGGLSLIMRHPDGGFRRLSVTTDGRGVITADGADQARVSIVDPATIEVAVAQDRYRLPATVRGRPLPIR